MVRLRQAREYTFASDGTFRVPGPGVDTAAGAGGHPRGGGAAAEGAENRMQDQPTLKVLNGGGDDRPLTGQDVLVKIAPVITDCLPHLLPGDPWRPSLERLLRAAPAEQRLRPVGRAAR